MKYEQLKLLKQCIDRDIDVLKPFDELLEHYEQNFADEATANEADILMAIKYFDTYRQALTGIKLMVNRCIEPFELEENARKEKAKLEREKKEAERKAKQDKEKREKDRKEELKNSAIDLFGGQEAEKQELPECIEDENMSEMDLQKDGDFDD